MEPAFTFIYLATHKKKYINVIYENLISTLQQTEDKLRKNAFSFQKKKFNKKRIYYLNNKTKKNLFKSLLCVNVLTARVFAKNCIALTIEFAPPSLTPL